MPVVFAQPEPMAPEIQQAAGRAEVMQHNNATLAQMYASANANSTQASIASAHNATQASIAHGQQFEQATAASEALGQRRQEFQAAQGPSDRDNWMAGVQAQAQQQHAQLQAWVHGQELSQAEQMQLQRDQNAVGHIEAMRKSGQLDDQTADDMVTQLRTRIDPARQRLERSKAEFEQQQMQKVMHADAQEETRRAESNKFWAQNAPDGALYMDDEDNIVGKDFAGHKRMFMRNHAGDPVEVNKAEKAAPAEKPLNDDGLSAQEYARQRHAVIRELDKKIAERDKMTAFQDGTGKPIGKPGSAGITADERRRFLEEDLQDAGLDPSGWKPANKGKAADTTGSDFPTATPGASGVPPGTPDQGPAAQPAAPRQPARPIPTDASQRTEEEKGTVDAFHQAFRSVDKMPIPDDQKESLKGGLKLQADLIQKRGSVLNMTPEERKDYLAADQKMFEVTKQGEMAKAKEAAKKAEESRVAGLRKRPFYVKPAPNDGYYPEIARQ